MSLINTLVHSVVDALVYLTHPIGEMTGVLLNQLTTTVGRASVNDNPFKAIKSLVYNTTDGLSQAITVIVVDSNK